MIKTSVREGSPGDDKIRYVSPAASDETSDMASKRRAFGGAEQRAASGSRWNRTSSSNRKLGFRMGERVMEGGQKWVFLERLIQQPVEE